ncbi:FecCD family ABC transporter permease [Salsuginibacillus kocurii]|uniref:FecCD family ABC transporter permease n=1 Tax=Salsuginibacillus kocurii TaxID=427078 RepID=UPI00037E383D|nr:iron ABC transporter permease [Salsuginibacillus kocurii]
MARQTLAKLAGLVVALTITCFLFMISLGYGYTPTTIGMVFEAYQANDGSAEHSVITTMRMPRALLAVLVGAALAVSGLIMQALTRNPMASPGILGVNAGASLAVVIAVTMFSVSSLSGYMWFAFAGAFIAAITVYALGASGPEGLTPLKMTLAGAALAALFSSFTSFFLILNEQTLDQVLFWLSGSVEGRGMEVIGPVLPFLLLGFVLSLFMGVKINALSVGEDVAKGLGQRTWVVKGAGLFIVVLLSGGAVAMAGPIGFIGLIIPHITRGLVGVDHRWLIPYCAVLGAALLLASDIAARFILYPTEVPVGVATAVVGAPFFIYLARKGVMKG